VLLTEIPTVGWVAVFEKTVLQDTVDSLTPSFYLLSVFVLNKGKTYEDF
jgi:hypothetical protein